MKNAISRNRGLTALVTIIALAWSSTAFAVVFVNKDAPPGGDGNSWATAYQTIQAGIDDAETAGEDVWVAAGIYAISSPVMMKSNVALYGGFPPTGNPGLNNRDPEAFVTTIDGQSSVYHVVACSSVANVRVDGFTITGGATGGSGSSLDGGGVYCANLTGDSIIANCTINGNASGQDGAGIFCTASALQIVNCTISENTCSHFGGGCAFRGNTTVTISGCSVLDNTSHSEGGGIECQNTALTVMGSTISGNAADYFGGGIRCYESSLTLSGCVVTGNNDSAAGAGIESHGGGAMVITNCTISGNTSGGDGGGVKSHSNTSLTITGSTISGNTAANIGGGVCSYGTPVTIERCVITGNAGAIGGGIESHESPSVSLSNTVIAGNTATSSGGGIQVWDNPTTITNCTIAGNSAPRGGGVLGHTPVILTNVVLASNTNAAAYEDTSGAEITARYCLFYSNPDGHFYDDDTATTFTAIAGPTGLDVNVPEASNNIEGDPLFADPVAGDHRLFFGSPCIDAGTSAGAPGADILGVPRPQGSGVDIGAYEYAASQDLDGDGLYDRDEVRDLDPDTPGVQNPFDPMDPDTTGDLFSNDPDGTPDGQNDYDGDGQSNAYELAHGSSPLDPEVFVPWVTMVGCFALVLLVLLSASAAVARRVRQT